MGRTRGGAQGSVYSMVLIISVTLGLAATATAILSTTRARHSDVSIQKRVALSAGEAACEAAAKVLIDMIADYDSNVPDDPQNPMPVDIAIGSDVISCTIAPADVAQQIETDADGVQSILEQWVVVANPVTAEGVLETVRTVYQSRKTPLFQYCVFYGGTCEIQPGPSMTLGGRVHSNSDIHVAVGSGNTLTVDTEYFRSAGDMWRHRLDGVQGYTTGTVRVKNANTGAFVNWDNGLESNSPNWVADTMGNWEGTVQSQDHGVTALSTPSVGSLQAGAGNYYWDKAYEGGIIIEDGQVFVNGNDVTALLPAGTVTSVTMANQREGRNVQYWEIDMDKLVNTDNPSSFVNTYFSAGSPFNGLIHASNSTATPEQPNGTRFKNADVLNQATAKSVEGLTVVSPQPVIVWGDWNDGDPGNYAENLSKKVGSAIIADSVELLSNAWTNSKVLDGGLPSASNTNYYMAILTGNVETSGPGGSYSGGLENLPRFHENWTGKTAKFRGSFVCLWESTYADGQWVYGGSYYTAPNRDWQYDNDLSDAANLPPFTPMAVGIDREVYWETGE